MTALTVIGGVVLLVVLGAGIANLTKKEPGDDE